MHKQGKGYKRKAKALNVPRDTVGSIFGKFKAKGTLATLPGQKEEATRFLRMQVVKVQKIHGKTEVPRFQFAQAYDKHCRSLCPNYKLYTSTILKAE